MVNTGQVESLFNRPVHGRQKQILLLHVVGKWQFLVRNMKLISAWQMYLLRIVVVACAAKRLNTVGSRAIIEFLWLINRNLSLSECGTGWCRRIADMNTMPRNTFATGA
jgi:hypothetical protein